MLRDGRSVACLADAFQLLREEGLEIADRRYPESAPHRLATEAEVASLRRELDLKWGIGFQPVPHDPTPNWARDRHRGAAGD